MPKWKIAVKVLSWTIRATLTVMIVRWVYLETGIVTTLIVTSMMLGFEITAMADRWKAKRENDLLENVMDLLTKLTERVQSNTSHVFRCQVVDAINRVCLMPVCPYEEKAKKRSKPDEE